MLRTLCLWGIFVSSLGAYTAAAQTTVGDSLRRQLGTLSPNDTAYALNLLYVWIAEGKSHPEAALESAQQALAASRRIGWLRGEVNALNAIALSKQRQGFYPEALTYYLPAVEISEKSGSPRHISKTHNNLGILYQLTADYPKALEHFRRVLHVEERPLDLAGVYNNIGIVFRNTQQPDSALAYYRKALDIHQKANDPRGMAPAFNNIGVVLRDRGDWAGALQQYASALAIYQQLNDRESRAVVLGSMGQALTQLGRYAAARDTLQRAFALAQTMGLLVAQGDIAGYFQDLYAREGRFAEAYRWAASNKLFGDSLQNIQKRDELAAIRARFESDKKVALLEKDVALERSRRLLWTASAIGLLLLLAVLAYALHQARRRRRIEADLQEKEIARLRAEDEARRLREEKLNEELDFRSRELNAQTLHLVQKNELLQSVSEQLQDASRAAAPNPSQLRSLQRLVESNLNDAEQWEDFKRHFEAVHPDFFRRLLAQYSGLTAHDLRYCAYLRLNLSSKEIAALLNVSLRGVETHRHRLRKKLAVDGETDLTAWAMRV
jgi:tetratricopeptide (TPR) repeat protein/DNA-binding CsgD family transcriptional regulator